MNQRTIGNTNLKIGDIGLGCWQLGGDFGPMEKSTAVNILETSEKEGVTFFDTADVYGSGRSESVIGEYLDNRDHGITVATKFGREPDVFPDGYTEKALREKTEASLKRLKTDALDLLQLHCIPMKYLKSGEIFDWLRKLKQEGKIRHFGASVETVEEGLECLKADGIASLQIIFNIFRQKPLKQLMPQAKKQGVGIIVRLPLASGLLAGKFTKDYTFDKSDHRNFNRDGQMFNVGETFAGLPFEKGVELADQLKPLVPEGVTMAQMSLRWILDYEEVSVIIPGASRPSQAIDNAHASDLPRLPESLHDRLATFYDEQVHEHIRGPY